MTSAAELDALDDAIAALDADERDGMGHSPEAAEKVAAVADLWLGPLHLSRMFEGSRIEDECPCPQEPCGFVSMARAVEECEHHPMMRGKTMRRMHPAPLCPAVRALTKGEKND